MFQLNDACRAASQRLHDIEACLGMLQSAEAPPAERAREADQFASSRSGLLAALSEIRRLIIQRFPNVLVERLKGVRSLPEELGQPTKVELADEPVACR